MPSFQQLRDCNPNLWEKAATEWENVSAEMRTAHSTITDDVAAHVKTGWPGPLGVDVGGHLTDLAGRFQVAQLEVEAIRITLSSAARSFGVAQRTLQAGLAKAKMYGLIVSDDGIVSTPPGMRPTDPEDRLILMGYIREVSALFREAIREADNADHQIALELQKLAGRTNVINVEDAKDADLNDATRLEVQRLLDSVPPGSDPLLIENWWNGLSKQDKTLLELGAPEKLAVLNGIPQDVKDSLYPSSGGFDRNKFVQWAMDHWDDSKLNTAGENYCTLFVSDALAAAGLKQTSGWSPDGRHEYIPFVDHHTRSWVNAGGLHNYLINNGSTEIPLNEARPGDVIFWQRQDGPKAGEWHHAAVVTGIVDGDIRYTQHSGSAQSASLNTREPFFESAEGRQRLVIVRVNQPSGSTP